MLYSFCRIDKREVCRERGGSLWCLGALGGLSLGRLAMLASDFPTSR